MDEKVKSLTDAVFTLPGGWEGFVRSREVGIDYIVYYYNTEPDTSFLTPLKIYSQTSRKTVFLVEASQNPKLLQKLNVHDVPCVLKVRYGRPEGVFHNEADPEVLRKWLSTVIDRNPDRVGLRDGYY